jgi:anti-anti-sigma regulatory factor
VLELSGEADIATMRMLRRELALLTTVDHADAEIDVTDLVFCDVASAHLLLTARRRVPLVLSGATGSVKRVFDLLDMLQTQRLPLYRSLAHPVGR